MHRQYAIGNLGILAIVGVMAVACVEEVSSDPVQAPPVEEFWNRLSALCGQAFEGTRTALPPNASPSGYPPLIHFSDCSEHEIVIRSMSRPSLLRTVVLRRIEPGRLELRHDYRTPEGETHPITGHGGVSMNPGTATVQMFPADALTVGNLPDFWSWVWRIEVHPGDRFVYFVQRVGVDNSGLRTEYDLTRPIEPFAPWPWEQSTTDLLPQR